MTEIDNRAFWRLLGVRAIGAAVVTTRDDSGPAGCLALSATHLTSQPPTLMVAIAETTSALPVIERAGHFAINYLAASDTELTDIFSGRTRLKGSERFNSPRWSTLETGSPIWPDGVGALDCQLEETIKRYSTTIAIGRLLAGLENTGNSPLISFRGTFIPLR